MKLKIGMEVDPSMDVATVSQWWLWFLRIQWML